MDYASITGGVAVEGFFWMWFESGCNWTFSDCGHSFFCSSITGRVERRCAGDCELNGVQDATLGSRSVSWRGGGNYTDTLSSLAGIWDIGGDGTADTLSFVAGVCVCMTGIGGVGGCLRVKCIKVPILVYVLVTSDP